MYCEACDTPSQTGVFAQAGCYLSRFDASSGSVANSTMPAAITPAVSHNAPLNVPVVCAI